MKEVRERIGKASQALGVLKEPVFKDKNLYLHTKRFMYKTVILASLLH